MNDSDAGSPDAGPDFLGRSTAPRPVRLADGNSPAPEGSSMRMRHGRGEITLTPGATLSMKTRFGGPLVARRRVDDWLNHAKRGRGQGASACK